MTAPAFPALNGMNPLYHPICFAKPKWLTSSAWREHIPFALFLIDILQPRKVVELGTQDGCSFCAFCQAVEELELATSCYAINNWQGDEQVALSELRAHHDPLYGGFSRLIESTFDEALEHFGDGTIDLLHLHGCRGDDAVKHVLESWQPKMTSCGIILLHDITGDRQDSSMCRSWAQLRVRYPSFEFFHGRGLGIFAAGEVPWPELQELFAAQDRAAAQIRKFFFHLGSHLTLAVQSTRQGLLLQRLQSELAARATPRTLRPTDAEEQPVRALLCSHNLNLEGAPYVQYEIALGLKQRGRVAPEIFSPADGPLGRIYREAGIPVHILAHPLDGVQTRKHYRARLQTFADWMGAQDFQVIHANTLNSFFAIDAAQRAGLPSLWNIHESVDWHTYFDQFGVIIPELALRAFTLTHRVIFVAFATKALFEPLATRNNFCVIHNGLRREAINRFLADHSPQAARARIDCPPGKTVCTIIGTVCDRKRQHDFARAAIELLRSGCDKVVFYIVGCRPSPYLDTLKALVKDYQADIRLIPETDQVYAYFRASDLFVCCSGNESYPRVTQEAMAFGLPIVTTPVFGIAEQVQDGVSALMYPVGNVDALVRHLRFLLDSPSERARLGRGALAALETLTNYEEMIDAYEQLFLTAVMVAGKQVVNQSPNSCEFSYAARLDNCHSF
jgi:glycosyltransferase involved in cell wall biosynthesis